MSTSRLEQLRAMLQEEPGDVFLRYAIALELRRSGETRQAVDMLEALVREHPGHLATYHQLATMLAELGNTEDAVACCEVGMLHCIVHGDMRTRSELRELRDGLRDEA